MNPRELAKNPFAHKSRRQRLAATVGHALDRSSGHSRFDLSDVGAQLRSPSSTAGRAGLVAGGVAGLTAVSAGISALRRTRGAGDDS